MKRLGQLETEQQPGQGSKSKGHRITLKGHRVKRLYYTSTPFHFPPISTWKSENWELSSSLNKNLPLKVMWWPWNVIGSNFNCTAHLRHYIFLLYQNEKALIIWARAVAQTRFVTNHWQADAWRPANSYMSHKPFESGDNHVTFLHL